MYRHTDKVVVESARASLNRVVIDNAAWWSLTGIIFLLAVAFLSRHTGLLQYQLGRFTASSAQRIDTTFPELAEIALHEQQWQFKDAQEYFSALAKNKGGAYAYNVLKVAELPPNIDMHLLGHTVGDVLYKQQGVAGMRVCTQDFRNACSHAIVVGLFGDEGEVALPKIVAACKEAPGGSGAYTMCFHGLGHGVFAAMGYEIEPTVSLCEKTGRNPGPNSPEAVECMGGMVMELMGGGDHDRAVWAKKRQKYVSNTDPLAPCNTALIPESAKYMCYVYLTPHLFQVAGAELARPNSSAFEKAFPYCDKLPKTDTRSRDACFGGFGKEFVVLTRGRDIRQAALAQVTDTQLQQAYDWCTLAHSRDGTAACVVHAANSLYWGGENPIDIAIRFCGLVSDEYWQGSCFTALFNSAQHYHATRSDVNELCAASPLKLQSECKKRLGNE